MMTHAWTRSSYIVGGILLAIVAVASGSIYWRAQLARAESDPERARREGRPIPVRTAQVQSREIDDVLGATAVTAPSHLAAIRVAASRRVLTSQSEGLRIKAVHVASGDSVTRGQLLFELEDQLLRLAVSRAQADLAAAKAGQVAQQAIVDSKNSKKTPPTPEDLQALAELSRTASKARQAEVELEFARADLDRALVKSPLDGFVSAVSFVPGVEVQAGHTLTEVLQLDPLHATVEVPEERIEDVRRGQEADIVLDSAPRQTLHGKVIQILPQGNPHERIVPVIVEFPNPGSRIKAGITGWVNLHNAKTVLSAPSAAIIRNGERAGVFVVEDGTVRFRQVDARGAADLGETVVRSGMKAGDEVVVFNQLYLQDRDRVDTDWRRWAHRN